MNCNYMFGSMGGGFFEMLLFVVLAGIVIALLTGATKRRGKQSVDMERKCTHCGGQLTQDWRYCPLCGTAVERAERESEDDRADPQ